MRRTLCACLASLIVLLAAAAPAVATPVAQTPTGSRAHAPAGPFDAVRERAAAAKVERYWTPARMRSARPLDLAMNDQGQVELRVRAALAEATTSFQRVSTPEVPPFSVNGRIFIRLGGLAGFCSGVARRSAIYAPKQWTKNANPDFDLGAFLAQPNAEGVNVADAVGGGATIVTDVSRRQQFQAFGYPGETRQMQRCSSPYIGDDVLSYPFPGPPTLGIRCRWAPGASGGAWLIGDGTQINGITSYLHPENKRRTYSPYFSGATVGRLVRGL